MNDNFLRFKKYYEENINGVLKSNNEQKDIEVIKEFNEEFPIDKIAKLSLDDYLYVVGSNDTFCGKLAYHYNDYEVGPNIKSGSINGKFGIYYNNGKYIDYNNNVIDQPERYFTELKRQLLDVLGNILRGNQDIDYSGYDHLSGMYNVILKLAYYIKPENNLTFGKRSILKEICDYFGIGVNSNDVSLNLSYRIKKMIDDNINGAKNIHSSNVGDVLWHYYEKYIKSGSNVGSSSESITNNVTTWLFQPGEQGKYWEECLNNNRIVLGFNNLTDLSNKSIDEIDDMLKKAYGKRNPKNDKKCLYEFVNKMSVNDIVIVKKGKDSLLGYGRVTSDYQYDPEGEFKHFRNVKWDKIGNWKNTIINNVQKTLTNITKYDGYPEELLSIIDDGIVISNETIKVGKNVIYYGVPGCGKSFQLDLEKNKYDIVIRTVFHPDYTYTDFIGQVMPFTKGKNVFYKPVPGPFTKALCEAYKDTKKSVLLIIEEINRGNAAAIFGDIFQLLDRESNYKINNEFICDYLRKNINGVNVNEFNIPNNMTIIATMNTSDQNVYTLDTAFRRRFSFKRIKNEFADNKESLALSKTKIAGLEIEWGVFVRKINDYIMNKPELLLNNEDKRLGVYSIRKEELVDKNMFADKVLFYLWDNIGKYNGGMLFDEKYKIYDQVIDDYILNNNVFCDELFDLLKVERIENNE